MISYKDRTYCNQSKTCPKNITCPYRIQHSDYAEAARIGLPICYATPEAFDCEFYLEANDGRE